LSAEFDVVELWSREWHDRTQQTLSSFIDEVKQAFMAFFRKKLLILIKDGQATRERIDQLGLLTSNFDELWEMEFAYDCEEYEVAIRELP